MRQAVTVFFSNLLSQVDLRGFKLLEQDDSTKDTPDIVEAVERAKKEWQNARAYFENVSDPDLVDYAIYAIEASEKKYMYLLKQAKKLGYYLNEGEKEQPVDGGTAF